MSLLINQSLSWAKADSAPYSVATSISLAESRTKLYRKLRDESQFMHQIKTDTLFNFETVKIFVSRRARLSLDPSN